MLRVNLWVFSLLLVQSVRVHETPHGHDPERSVVQPGPGTESEAHFHCPRHGVRVLGARWLVNGTELSILLSGKFEFIENFSPDTEIGWLILFNFSLDANGTLIQCQAMLRDGRPVRGHLKGIDSSFVNRGIQDTDRDSSGTRIFISGSETKVSKKYHFCYPRYENGKILIQPHVVKTETLNGFCKEVQLMLKVGQHANVVKSYGATYEEQELIPGGTMKDLIDRCHQEIDIELIRKWTIQCMRGLIHLHRNGIAHHDLHASNVLLDSEGIRICIADSGNSSVRCDECKSCNELSTYGQSCADCVNSYCRECAEWKDGRIHDIREIAILVYQLTSVPRRVDMDGVWEESVGSIGRRDKNLSTFAAECMKLRPSQDLLEILTPSPLML